MTTSVFASVRDALLAIPDIHSAWYDDGTGPDTRDPSLKDRALAVFHVTYCKTTRAGHRPYVSYLFDAGEVGRARDLTGMAQSVGVRLVDAMSRSWATEQAVEMSKQSRRQ